MITFKFPTGFTGGDYRFTPVWPSFLLSEKNLEPSMILGLWIKDQMEICMLFFIVVVIVMEMVKINEN